MTWPRCWVILSPKPLPVSDVLGRAKEAGISRYRVYMARQASNTESERAGLTCTWRLLNASSPAPAAHDPGRPGLMPDYGGRGDRPPSESNMVLTPARVFDISHTAAEKIAEAVGRKTSAAAGNEEAPTRKGRGGRKRDPLTARLYEFCYIEYRIKGRPRSAVFMHAVGREFPAKPLKEECTVTTYANRHADNQKPALPPRPHTKTGREVRQHGGNRIDSVTLFSLASRSLGKRRSRRG